MKDLSQAELRERRLHVDSALGSMALEGLHPDPITLSMHEDYAAGRIDLDELRRGIDGLVERYRSAAVTAV